MYLFHSTAVAVHPKTTNVLSNSFGTKSWKFKCRHIASENYTQSSSPLKTLKLLDESIGEILDTKFGNSFLVIISKAQAPKANIN